jgi:hypothetical protein
VTKVRVEGGLQIYPPPSEHRKVLKEQVIAKCEVSAKKKDDQENRYRCYLWPLFAQWSLLPPPNGHFCPPPPLPILPRLTLSDLCIRFRVTPLAMTVLNDPLFVRYYTSTGFERYFSDAVKSVPRKLANMEIATDGLDFDDFAFFSTLISSPLVAPSSDQVNV